MMTVLEEDKKYVLQVYSPEPIVIEKAHGMFLMDKGGKEYLDFSAQFSACSLGHGNEELIAAIEAQMRRLISVTSMFVTEERVALAKKLTAAAPEGLTKVLFGCTGSDANEFALKAAKCYRGGGKIFSFWRGFHGSTAASAGATGKSETIQENTAIAELLPRGFLHTSPPYCYRCDFGKEPVSCGFQCLRYLEQQMLHEGGERIAAVITEPVFAAGGVIVPPEGYMKELRALCDRYGALLIFDEVVTGIGQTGKMFACEHTGVTPDILVTGKALTGGYVPGSAVLVKQKIADVMDPLTLHGHTHSFYPGMCAAAIKNLEIIAREKLIESAAAVGAYLGDRLHELKARYPEIGDVRGVGLLQGIEIVKSGSKEKEADFALAKRLFDGFLQGGLLTELESRANLKNAVIVLHPPLITAKADIDLAVQIMDRVFQVCRKA